MAHIDNEFKVLLRKFPPTEKNILDKGIDSEDFVCAKGKNPSGKKIVEFCSAKYNCKHLLLKEVVEQQIKDFNSKD